MLIASSNNFGLKT